MRLERESCNNLNNKMIRGSKFNNCGSTVKVQQLKLEPVDLELKVQNMMKLESKHDEIEVKT